MSPADQLDLFPAPAPAVKSLARTPPKRGPEFFYRAFMYWLPMKRIHVTGKEKTFEEKVLHERMDAIAVAGTKSRLLNALGGLAAVW